MNDKRKILIPPKFPESEIEFRGEFYSVSEFEIYKASSKYKWDNFWNGFIAVMLLVSIVSVYVTIIIVKLNT